MPASLIGRNANYRPLYVEDSGVLWAGRYLTICRSTDDGKTFEPVASYDGGVIDRIAAHRYTVRRALRGGLLGMTRLSNGTNLLTVRKRILRMRADEDRIEDVFRLSRGTRPLTICESPDGFIYFGEYFSNKQRDEAHVYVSADGGDSWDVAYTFSKGEIRHIHGVIYDPFRKGLWIVTGDDDRESRILFTEDNFSTVDTVLGGSQRTRAATLIPLADGIIVPTDTPQEQNYIQWFEPNENRLQRVHPVPGSVFYSFQAGEYCVLSVAVERSAVNRTDDASLWVSKNGFDWACIHENPKDNWPTRHYRRLPRRMANRVTMQHGLFLLPQGRSNRPILHAYGQALIDDDERMMTWNLGGEAEAPESIVHTPD
jgi:hypothetical protein